MQIISKNIDLDRTLIKPFLKEHSTQEIFLLDIETTGFDRMRNQIFLIGCIYFTDQNVKLVQWICEKKEDEYEMLFRFSQFIKSYKIALHYNGNSFDIPFIKARLKTYRLPSIPELKEIDLYSSIRKLQSILPLENSKLKTIEAFFGFHRSDKLDGGLVVKLYNEFIKNPTDSARDMLLLHNEEDLLGLYQCLHSLIYTDFFKKAREQSIELEDMVMDVKETSLSLTVAYRAGFQAILSIPPYTLNISDQSVSLILPILEEELKLYFKDYYNYFYLPLEEKVVHQSIGKFVDKMYRKRATKENCYIKKRGTFIPLVLAFNTTYKTYFYDYKDKIQYVEYSDELQNDKTFFQNLLLYVLSKL